MPQILAQIIPLGSDIPSVASLGRMMVGPWQLWVPDPALQLQLPWSNLECLGAFLTGQLWEATQETGISIPGKTGAAPATCLRGLGLGGDFMALYSYYLPEMRQCFPEMCQYLIPVSEIGQ